MTEQDLKPCPFCGGKAEVASVETDNGKYIRCSHCRASTALYYGRFEHLVDAWNDRH